MSTDTMSTAERREYAEGWGAGYHSITVPVGTPTTAAWRQGYGHGACKHTPAPQADMHYRDVLGICLDDTERLSGDNPEYERGQLELLADLFARPGVERGERVLEIEADIRALDTEHTYVSTASLYVDAANETERDDKLRELERFAEGTGARIILPDEPSQDWTD